MTFGTIFVGVIPPGPPDGAHGLFEPPAAGGLGAEEFAQENGSDFIGIFCRCV